MTTRPDALGSFIRQAGWAGSSRAPLAGDASDRRYERVTHHDGRQAVLMDAPPDKNAGVGSFVRIATHLRDAGLSAPRILARDDAQGFVLLEDLGDDLFARVLETSPGHERRLYTAAVDVLSHLHRAPSLKLQVYTAATMAPLTAPAFDWYQFGTTGRVDDRARLDLQTTLQRLLAPFDVARPVIIQRDYHAENLLWLPDRSGPARVGLLDFQDAVLGHPAYDLVSLLQDARRDVSPQVVQHAIDHFLQRNPQDKDGFKAAYAGLGAQRNLRILGIFARLCLASGKAQYIDLIPRVWRHIDTNLAHPALAPLADLVREALPQPTKAVLHRLRTKCATYPDR